MNFDSKDEFKSWAQGFGEKIINKGQGIVLLHGEMGAGKTTFVTWALQGLDAMVTSPTFSIINQYEPNIFHIDLYRVQNPDEFENLGLGEILTDSNIVFIEWAKNLPAKYQELIPAGIEILIEQQENDRRRVTINE